MWNAEWNQRKFNIEILKDKLEALGADWNDLEKLCSLFYLEGSDDGYKSGYDDGNYD